MGNALASIYAAIRVYLYVPPSERPGFTQIISHNFKMLV